jgi:hypothetical protein
MLSQTREDAELRGIINNEIVDGLEYAKVREKICLAKQRAQEFLDVSEDSDASESRSEQEHETA